MLSFTKISMMAAALGVAQAQTCIPNFAGQNVAVFVSGTWSASPVAAGSSIVPADSSTMTFSVTPDASQAFSFKTAAGSLAVSGASGGITLQTANDNDALQKYLIDCSECNVFGNPATARGCQIRPFTNQGQCLADFGIDLQVATVRCDIPVAGRFWHFNAV